MKIAILFITHNRFDYLKITLSKLLEKSGHEFDLYLVDNNSDESIKNWLVNYKHPFIKQKIFNNENISLRKVTNDFWFSTKNDYDYIGKVDSDVIIYDNWINDLVKILNTPKINFGVVGPTHFNIYDINRVDKNVYKQHIKKINENEFLWVKHIGGACYLMPASNIDKFGYIEDAGYFKGGWTEYQWKMYHSGHYNGITYPIKTVKHLDDPRYSECLKKFNMTKERFGYIEVDSITKLLKFERRDELFGSKK